MTPKRISMGCYEIRVGAQQILLRRCGRSGFRIEHRPGAISPLIKRLRDAAAIAVESANPWPFTVEKIPDLAADLPHFLDRRSA